VSPVKYQLGFYIPEDGILHSYCRENHKSYIVLTGYALWRRCNLSPVRYELGFYIAEDGILQGCFVRFGVFTAVTMKNGVFWDVTPCGSCKNRRFGVT
jgi:hypothetical protein